MSKCLLARNLERFEMCGSVSRDLVLLNLCSGGRRRNRQVQGEDLTAFSEKKRRHPSYNSPQRVKSLREQKSYIQSDT